MASSKNGVMRIKRANLMSRKDETTTCGEQATSQIPSRSIYAPNMREQKYGNAEAYQHLQRAEGLAWSGLLKEAKRRSSPPAILQSLLVDNEQLSICFMLDPTLVTMTVTIASVRPGILSIYLR